jgi:hypothetical protein
MWFADDALGFQRGSDPPFPEQRHIYRGYRDYFHGLGRELEDATGPPSRIISAPHRSMVYRRASTGEWSVALSVPVWDDPNNEATARQVGVIGLAIGVKTKTRVAGQRERFAVLVDTRADANGKRGLILRHPVLDDPGATALLIYSEDVVKWADSGNTAFPEEESYRDPVGGAFAGEWLASVERVIVRPEDGKPVDTGWVLLVQERKRQVLEPVTALQWQLGRGAAVAGIFLLIVIVIVWTGTVSVLDSSPKSRMTRWLRRWAGLPTSTIGAASSTHAAGTGPPSGSSGVRVPDAGRFASPGAPTTDYTDHEKGDNPTPRL